MRDLTLTLASGAVHGLVGANGGGKSTALRLLAGALAPSGGSGRVLGVDLADGGRRRLRARLGYMTQGFSLFPDLTVRENLAFRAEIFDLAGARRVVDRALGAFDLRPRADMRAGRLSAGWARRLHLAAVLLPKPPLLLLDEPTAGLDIAARLEVWRRLAAEVAAGAAIVVATHDLAEAERCDAVSLLFDGAAQAPAAPSDLVSRAAAVARRAGRPAPATLEDVVRGLLAERRDPPEPAP